MGDTKHALSFEKSMEKLEEIVKKLEGGADSLESSLKLFEEGVALARHCNETLDKAEKKLEVLMKKGDRVEREELDEGEFFDTPGSGDEV